VKEHSDVSHGPLQVEKAGWRVQSSPTGKLL